MNKLVDLKTELGDVQLISKNIFLLTIRQNLELDVEKGVVFRDEFLKLVKHKRIALVVDARDVIANASMNSLRFFTNDVAFNQSCVLQAIITNNIHIRLLANFYIHFLKKRIRVKLFNSNDDALNWVENNLHLLQ